MMKRQYLDTISYFCVKWTCFLTAKITLYTDTSNHARVIGFRGNHYELIFTEKYWNQITPHLIKYTIIRCMSYLTVDAV